MRQHYRWHGAGTKLRSRTLSSVQWSWWELTKCGVENFLRSSRLADQIGVSDDAATS